MKYYLIKLFDHKDTYLTLIGEKSWEWIFSYKDEVPIEAQNEMRKLNPHTSPLEFCDLGYDIERAQAVVGMEFYSNSDLKKWLQKNNAKIEDELEGPRT